MFMRRKYIYIKMLIPSKFELLHNLNKSLCRTPLPSQQRAF
jgi:hypothetical protein